MRGWGLLHGGPEQFVEALDQIGFDSDGFIDHHPLAAGPAHEPAVIDQSEHQHRQHHQDQRQPDRPDAETGDQPGGQ